MQSYPPPRDVVDREIEQYIRDDEKTAQALRFYSRLYQVQRELAEKMPPVVSRREAAGENLRGGKPLLWDNSLVIPYELFREMLAAIAGLAGQESLPPAAEEFADICGSRQAVEFFSDPANLAGDNIFLFLLEKISDSESRLPALAFLVKMTVKPFYVSYATAIRGNFNFKIWDKGICPVCGQRPMLATLSGENGARALECGLCHTVWEFYRRTCPACGNNDHESLGFFYQPGKEYRRVYVCHKCRFYVKTAVLKDSGRKIIPDLENAATMYLDFLAHKEGYGFTGPGSNTH
jgi:FdhE protein